MANYYGHDLGPIHPGQNAVNYHTCIQSQKKVIKVTHTHTQINRITKRKAKMIKVNTYTGTHTHKRSNDHQNHRNSK